MSAALHYVHLRYGPTAPPLWVQLCDCTRRTASANGIVALHMSQRSTIKAPMKWHIKDGKYHVQRAGLLESMGRRELPLSESQSQLMACSDAVRHRSSRHLFGRKPKAETST